MDNIIVSMQHKNFDEAIGEIQNIVNNMAGRTERLIEENERLKSEHYKDDELDAMREEVCRCKEDLGRGFPISKEENGAIIDWHINHMKKHHPTNGVFAKYNGCNLVYEFDPTELGTVGTVYCERCRSKALKELGYEDNYSSWIEYIHKRQELMKKYDAEFEFQSI